MRCVIKSVMASARELVEQAGLPDRDAEVLLLGLLGKDRGWLFAHRDDPLPLEVVEGFAGLVRRRAAGEPVAYILGEREFWSLPLKVTPAVLIPRPDTEVLVEWALAIITAQSASRALDLGAGSGAIALALAKNAPSCQVTGVDVSEAALAVARGNADALSLDVEWIRSDWFAELGSDLWPIIVSNPPYIASTDPHLSQGDLTAEPASALIGGEDGLDCIRSIVKDAPNHLVAGGWVLLEHGWDQGADVRDLLLDRGFRNVATRTDLAGHERVTGGCWP